MRQRLQQAIDSVRPVDQALAAKGQAHLDDLTKPKGSLGRLEELALRLYLIRGGRVPLVDPARIYAIAGDHGAAAHGVSLFPQEVTRQMVANFCAGGAAINALCATADIDLKVVDAGCLGPEFPDHPHLIRRKVAQGTADIRHGPAMTEEQCVEALRLGLDLAGQAAASGFLAVGTGDMGIGNTFASAALYCALLGLDPLEITGPGTGLPPERVAWKATQVALALETNREAVESGDPLRILAALGGLEIAALAGLVIGGAANRLAVVVDGFISTAAYACARAMQPAVADYAFLAHASAEPGHARAMAALGEVPLLDLGMRLGEGTGSALALFLLRSAAAVFNSMATFSGAGISRAH